MELADRLFDLVYSYRYPGLYVYFVVDTLGVVLPSKTILTLTGVLVQSGRLSFLPLFLSALTGSLTGFCISYAVGLKIGKPVLSRYGRYLGASPERVRRAEGWFVRFGPPFIIIAYFTPGLRHVTPYLSGMSGMTLPRALGFAAVGAALWIATFVSLGRFFGMGIGRAWELLDRWHWQALLLLALAAVALVLVRLARKKQDKPEVNPEAGSRDPE